MTDVHVYVTAEVPQVCYEQIVNVLSRICQTESQLIAHERCTKMNNKLSQKPYHQYIET